MFYLSPNVFHIYYVIPITLLLHIMLLLIVNFLLSMELYYHNFIEIT